VIETINKIVRTSRLMFGEIGREPSPELAQKLHMPLEKVRKTLKIAKELLLLETPIGDEGDSHFGDLIDDKDAILPIDAATPPAAWSGPGNPNNRTNRRRSQSGKLHIV